MNCPYTSFFCVSPILAKILSGNRLTNRYLLFLNLSLAQIGTKIVDINDNFFTVIKADKTEESDTSFFMSQKLTIEA